MEKKPVSLLQEYCFTNNLPVARYDITGQGTSFECHCSVNDTIKGYGTGMSKIEAKHNAANNAISKIRDVKISAITNPKSSAKQAKVFKNAVGELNELCSKRGWPYPDYEFRTSPEGYTAICKHRELMTIGQDLAKMDAKQKSAALMLEKID